MDNQKLWQAMLGSLEINLSKGNFITWFKNTDIVERGENYITVGVPSTFTHEWIKNKFHNHLLQSLKSLAPEVKEIRYHIGNIKLGQEKQGTLLQQSESTSKNTVVYKAPNTTGSSSLNKQYTFDTLIIGKNNELAHAASVAVAESPGSRYNPLFIYGGVGLGKTHLIHAVGNKMLANNPRLRILYATSEKFTNDFISAIQQKKLDDFKRHYRQVDMLLIDDVQFIAGKEQTQEEFFHTFNELRDKGKQIILTSDRLPKDIPAIEQRLISRFEWGMIADVGAPSLETRIAILKTKIAKSGIAIDDKIINFVAENVVNNIRELEGALNKIMVYYNMSREPLTLNKVQELLESITNNNKRKSVTIRKIAENVAGFYSVTLDDLLKQSRKKEFVKPRQAAMYLVRKELNSSFPTIGEFFGGRDHTTVMHGVEKVEKAVKSEDNIKKELDLILERLYNG